MSGVVVIEANIKIRKILAVFFAYALHQLFGGYTFGFGAQHDRRAVGVVGAHVNALVSAQFLKPHPDVGLNVFHHMAQVYRTVRIRQGAGD